jgi:putative RecB family exonuclease
VSAPPPPSLDELLEFYEQRWLAAGYESPEEEAKYKEYGWEILSRFWEIHNADFRLPVALEKGFSLDIEGIKLRGFIDRVDKLDSGGLSIVDYKSNQELFTTEYLENDLQLTIYQLAAEATWGLPVERLTLYHLRSNTPCSCPPRDAARLEEARQIVLTTAADIAAGKFSPTENQYCPCDFAEHCPFYRHLYQVAEAAPSPTQAQLPGLAAAEAVERYADLREQVNELKLEMEEARQQIIAFCQAEGLNRVFGTSHEATYKLMERTGYREEDVRAVLEPAGLWEKVVGLDQARLKDLLEDAQLAGELKKELESLKRVISAFPQLSLKKRAGEEE